MFFTSFGPELFQIKSIIKLTNLKMKKIIALALVAFVALSFNVKAQTADEIVNKYIDAIGGKDKIKSIKSMRLSGKLMGQGMEFPFTQTFKYPAQKMEMTIQGMSMVQAFDGKIGWYIAPFQGDLSAHKMNENDSKELADDVDAGGELYDYQKKGNKLEFLGKDDMDGTEVFKLKVAKKNGNIETYFFDAQTYLLLKVTSKVMVQDKEMESETEFSNYKTVDGFTFPHSATASMQGEMKIEKLEINPVVEDKIFAVPADAK